MRPVTADATSNDTNNSSKNEENGEKLVRLSHSSPPVRPSEEATPPPAKPPATTAETIEALLRQKLTAAHARRHAHLKKVRSHTPNKENNSNGNSVPWEELRSKLRDKLNELYALQYEKNLHPDSDTSPLPLATTQKPLPQKEGTTANTVHSARFPKPPSAGETRTPTDRMARESLLEDTLRRAVTEASARHRMQSGRREEEEDVFLRTLNATCSSMQETTILAEDNGGERDLTEEALYLLLDTDAAKELLEQAKNASEIENNKLLLLQNSHPDADHSGGINARRVELLPPYRKPRWEVHPNNNCYEVLWESSSVEEEEGEEGGHTRRGKPKYVLHGNDAAMPLQQLQAVPRWRCSCPPSPEVSDTSSEEEEEEEEEDSTASRSTTSEDSEEDDDTAKYVYTAYYDKTSKKRYFNYTLPVTLEILPASAWDRMVHGSPKKKANKKAKGKGTRRKVNEEEEAAALETDTKALEDSQGSEESIPPPEVTPTVVPPQGTNQNVKKDSRPTNAPATQKSGPAQDSITPFAVVGSAAPQEERIKVIPPKKSAPKEKVAKKAKPEKKRKKKKESEPIVLIGGQTLPCTMMLGCIRDRTRLSGILFRLRRALDSFFTPNLLPVQEDITAALKAAAEEKTKRQEKTSSDSSEDTTEEEEEEDEESVTDELYRFTVIRQLPLYYRDATLPGGYTPLQSEPQWKVVQQLWWEKCAVSKTKRNVPFLKLYYVWGEK
ncbi:hypothetical protein ADEAN_000816300 [Angomonas deanei]|uniref:Uncharacterized protein n=1 Tax=Angomonas deanei TaxID=59799 RepID=A0A7G2CNW8_9TRYP|nr:hypothetical protein ADEAN_000816300 [Angomonas deanei]